MMPPLPTPFLLQSLEHYHLGGTVICLLPALPHFTPHTVLLPACTGAERSCVQREACGITSCAHCDLTHLFVLLICLFFFFFWPIAYATAAAAYTVGFLRPTCFACTGISRWHGVDEHTAPGRLNSCPSVTGRTEV